MDLGIEGALDDGRRVAPGGAVMPEKR